MRRQPERTVVDCRIAVSGALASRRRGIDTRHIHLGVQMNNAAGRRFWEREGFAFLREAPVVGAADPTPTVHVLGKTL